MDPQQALPADLYNRILDRLSTRTLTRIQGVNRAWRRCATGRQEDRWQRRSKRAQAHRLQGTYAPVRLQTPDGAPYKIGFSPCSRRMTVHFVCQPPEMFGILAYAPSTRHDLVLGRRCALDPMINQGNSALGAPMASMQMPQVLDAAIAGRLARWHRSPAPVFAITPDGHTLAWLDAEQAYMLDLRDSCSTPVQLIHPDHAKFTGWIDFSPDSSYIMVGTLILDSYIGAALFDFGAARLY